MSDLKKEELKAAQAKREAAMAALAAETAKRRAERLKDSGTVTLPVIGRLTPVKGIVIFVVAVAGGLIIKKYVFGK